LTDIDFSGLVEGYRKRQALHQSDIRTISWMIRNTTLTEASKETITEWWPIPLIDPKQKESLAKKTFTPDEIKKIFGNYYPS